MSLLLIEIGEVLGSCLQGCSSIATPACAGRGFSHAVAMVIEVISERGSQLG